MTTITAHAPRETGLFGRFGHVLAQFFDALAEARTMAARYDHLSGMSDSDLARLGITRQDIPRVVVSGR